MNNSIEIYHSQDGSVQLNVKLENETVWLTQSQMAELFGKDRTTINRHISNIFKEGELDESLVCAKMHTPRITDVEWATSVLKQYLIKGYVVNQQIKLDRYNELKDVVRLMSRSIVLQDKVTTDEYSGLLKSNIRQIYQTFSA